MLAYYHMENLLAFWQLDQTIFEGVIALFDMEYYIQKFVHSIHSVV